MVICHSFLLNYQRVNPFANYLYNPGEKSQRALTSGCSQQGRATLRELLEAPKRCKSRRVSRTLVENGRMGFSFYVQFSNFWYIFRDCYYLGKMLALMRFHGIYHDQYGIEMPTEIVLVCVCHFVSGNPRILRQ